MKNIDKINDTELTIVYQYVNMVYMDCLGIGYAQLSSCKFKVKKAVDNQGCKRKVKEFQLMTFQNSKVTTRFP